MYRNPERLRLLHLLLGSLHLIYFVQIKKEREERGWALALQKKEEELRRREENAKKMLEEAKKLLRNECMEGKVFV